MNSESDLARGWPRRPAISALPAWWLTATVPTTLHASTRSRPSKKSLKGFLAFHRQPIPRTHDLEELQQLCLALESLPHLAALDLTEATDYGVIVRYDLDFWPEQDTAADALALAEKVFGLILDALPPEYRLLLPNQEF